MANTTPNKVTIAAGILTVLVGTIPPLEALSILPSGNESFDPAPSWIGWLIGAIFMGAGFIAIMRGAWNASDSSAALPAAAPRVLRLAHDALSVGIMWGLAVLSSWVAFGPGPRHFSVGAGGVWMPTSGPDNLFGRVAFGFGAILVWCIMAAFAVTIARRWRR